jgi:ubiquinone/menaquinone biosynthesis C-methylase UbiE
MAYQIIEASLADLDRLNRYHLDGVYGAAFGIKGFEYPWLVSSYDWKKEIKVLDVGAAYSPLPIYLQKTFGCEVWAADDFGATIGDDYWKRGRLPLEYIKNNPEVKYILERLGDSKKSSLPSGYFDVVYCLSVLEHVASHQIPAVWKHMDSLLKPGGDMMHGIDLSFPSNGGVSKLFSCLIFDWLHAVVPSNYRQKHIQATPLNYLRQVARVLGIKLESIKGLDVLSMSLSPNTLVESCQWGLNRIIEEKIQGFHFTRFGSLMLRLRKLS